MRRKVVAGMLTFAMFGMSLSSFSPTQVCAADDLGKVEVHVSAKEGGYDQTLPDLQFEKADAAQSSGYVKVYPDEKRQTFLGVGGAMTESAAYNLQKLSKEQQEEVYEAYFGESGAKYSVLRSTIGSADFSTRSYSYNDTEEPDPDLKNFSIEKDWDYIIPAIQKAQSYRPDIKFFAAPWAPPAWMKNSGVRRGQTGTAGLNFVDNSVKPEINDHLKDNALSILKAWEIDEAKDTLNITCKVLSATKNRITVRYDGNVMTDGGIHPTAIFYTNTLSLSSGSDIGLSYLADPATLASYVLSDDCTFPETDAETAAAAKTFLKESDQSYYTALFQNADFPYQETFPECFSYEYEGSIYFSLPVAHALGDYILAVYTPENK